jgi:CP family cyanate transporter-like MFS transporter
VPLASRSVVIYAITGIILFSLGLRTGVAAVSPLATVIDLDVALVGLPLGALGTIPPIAYALAASVSPWFAKRVGVEWAAVLMSVLAGLAHVWRGISPSYTSFFAATVVLMLAAGVGNVIVPGLVKLYAPRAIGQVTAAYTTAMALSSASPAVIGIWLADEFGWRFSLASWSLVSIIGALPWLLVIPFAKVRGLAEAELVGDISVGRPRQSLWKSPTAVSIMVIFSVSGTTAYTWFAVLPVILFDISGLSVAQSGAALGLFAILGLPLSLVIPPLAAKRGVAPILVGAAVVFGLVGILGLLFLPTVATLLWVSLLGLAPLAFHLSLTLIGRRTRDHLGALELSGFVNTMGYTIAASGPLLVGLLFQLTGEWTLGLVFLAISVACQIPAIWVLAREGIVEDELAAAHSAR